MSPQPPKTEVDEKMENHFNSIVIAVLGIIALAILIAIIFFFKRGAKAVPPTHRQSANARQMSNGNDQNNWLRTDLIRSRVKVQALTSSAGDGIHLKPPLVISG